MFNLINRIIEESSLSLASNDHDGEIMPCHYGIGLFPYYKNNWLLQLQENAKGYMYLSGTKPGELVGYS